MTLQYHVVRKATKNGYKIFDLIEEFVAERLLQPNGITPREVVRAAVNSFPHSSAMDICFALAAVAAALETPVLFSPKAEPLDHLELHKAITALFADIYAYEKVFGLRPDGRNIAEFWNMTNEQYFNPPQRALRT